MDRKKIDVCVVYFEISIGLIGFDNNCFCNTLTHLNLLYIKSLKLDHHKGEVIEVCHKRTLSALSI